MTGLRLRYVHFSNTFRSEQLGQIFSEISCFWCYTALIVYNRFFKNPFQNQSKETLLLYIMFGRIASRLGVRGVREIRKFNAGRRHRRPRVQKHVRNVSSDVPVTYTGRRSVTMEYI